MNSLMRKLAGDRPFVVVVGGVAAAVAIAVALEVADFETSAASGAIPNAPDWKPLLTQEGCREMQREIENRFTGGVQAVFRNCEVYYFNAEQKSKTKFVTWRVDVLMQKQGLPPMPMTFLGLWHKGQIKDVHAL